MSAVPNRNEIMSPTASPTGSPTGSASMKTPSTASPVVSPNPSSPSPDHSETYSEFETRMDNETSPGNNMTDEDRARLHGEYGISPIATPSPAAALDVSSSMDSDNVSPSPLSLESIPEAPTNRIFQDKTPSPLSFPEVPTHLMPRRRNINRNIDDDATHALENFDETPPDFNDEAAHNDYYRRFVEFHRNPTMSRNRRPFAKGRRHSHRHRHRTHKCKPCKRRRPCKKTMKRRKRHYKKGRKSHKRQRRN